MWFIWDGVTGPNLTMGMWVTASHDFATILKYLNVVDIGQRADFGVLLGPRIHDAGNFCYVMRAKVRS
jgi:hypothetical protein